MTEVDLGRYAELSPSAFTNWMPGEPSALQADVDCGAFVPKGLHGMTAVQERSCFLQDDTLAVCEKKPGDNESYF